MELKLAIEGVFLDLIKVVGDDEHTYRGTPAEMIDRIETAVNLSIADYNESIRP